MNKVKNTITCFFGFIQIEQDLLFLGQQNMLFVDLHVESSSYCLYKDHTFQFGGFT